MTAPRVTVTRAEQTVTPAHEIVTGAPENVPRIARTLRISTSSSTSTAKFPNRSARILRYSTNGNLWTAIRRCAIFSGTTREFASSYSETQTRLCGTKKLTTGTRIVTTPIRIKQIATVM